MEETNCRLISPRLATIMSLIWEEDGQSVHYVVGLLVAKTEDQPVNNEPEKCGGKNTYRCFYLQATVNC